MLKTILDSTIKTNHNSPSKHAPWGYYAAALSRGRAPLLKGGRRRRLEEEGARGGAGRSSAGVDECVDVTLADVAG